MFRTMMTGAAIAALLGGCGAADNGPSPKRQPGSWSQKLEIVDVSGEDADKARAQMGMVQGMLNSISVCVTPEIAAKENPSDGMTKFGGGGGDCTYDQKDLTGKDISVSGVCKDKDGSSVKISAQGTLATTSQDFTMTVEGKGPKGGAQKLQLKMHSQRNGECTAKDLKVPNGSVF